MYPWAKEGGIDGNIVYTLVSVTKSDDRLTNIRTIFARRMAINILLIDVPTSVNYPSLPPRFEQIQTNVSKISFNLLFTFPMLQYLNWYLTIIEFPSILQNILQQ